MNSDDFGDFEDLLKKEIKQIKFTFEPYQSGFIISNEFLEYFSQSDVRVVQDYLMEAYKAFIRTFVPLHEEYEEVVTFQVYKTWWDHLKDGLPYWIRKRLSPVQYKSLRKTVTVSLVGKNIDVPDKFNSGYYTVYST